ncbi:MAG: aminotransferase class III-fold pyridoxal phosphate-dependent enzyme [Candidatus Leucobacter sulfamidivorax]|nr:aminotransferase class III-fold pyridoxal phosphate-dependent enzyme [Candidatus Leucobacter sulfamidivorax]
MPSLTLDSALDTFSQRFATSARYSREGSESIPGGYSRSSFNFGPHAIFVERGEGARIETVDGHSMLDLNNNFTVNVLGHDHPAIREALLAAIPSGISFGNPGLLEGRLAEILIERVPSVERVQFSCSATESCMSAIRVARGFTGRTRYAKFEGGYHGFSDVLHISSHAGPDDDCGSDTDPKPVPDSGGIPANDVANVVMLPQNDWESCERILRANAADLACLILELQSGAGGLVALDRDFVARLRELTSELGILLIFDETISLRAGYHGAQGLYGVTPDLTVMGKMIGGGMPLGALGGSAEVMGALESGAVSISGTHHGHKLALAAGIACMETMDRAAFDRLNACAGRVMSEVNGWAASRGVPFAVYGAGYSHLSYGYFTGPEREARSHRDYWRLVDGERTQTISLELANRGIFPVHRGEFSLSLPMSDDDISEIVATFTGVVADLAG